MGELNREVSLTKISVDTWSPQFRVQIVFINVQEYINDSDEGMDWILI